MPAPSNESQDAKLILALQVAKLAVKGGAPERDATSKHAYQAPNVLVAHLEEGIEAVHLYSGRTLCKLHLPPPGLHADLNGDGVLDHVQARAMTSPKCMPCIRLAEFASGHACSCLVTPYQHTSVQRIHQLFGHAHVVGHVAGGSCHQGILTPYGNETRW